MKKLFLALFLLSSIGLKAQLENDFFYQYVDPTINLTYTLVTPPTGVDSLLLYSGSTTTPFWVTFGNGISYDSVGHALSVSVGKTDVGLSNVDNTSDANKPVSTATGTALAGKEPSIAAGMSSQYWRGDKTWANFPSIPAAQVNADWSSGSGISQILNKPSLATVATSGVYNDLTGKPTLSTVGISGLFADLLSKPTTLSGYGITDPVVLTSGSYANPSWITSFAWSKISTTPTTLSGYGITDPIVLTWGSYANPSWISSLAYAKITGAPSLATVATTGAYSDLTGKPSLATVATTGAYADLTGKPSLATVATTGSYTDLINKPAARSSSSATHTFVSTTSSTGFQVSALRDCNVSYSVSTVTTATIGGNSSGTIFLEIAATNSTTPGDWTTIAKMTNGQAITLAVILQSSQTIGSTLSGYVPAGYYARLRTLNNSGTPTYTYECGQETLL